MKKNCEREHADHFETPLRYHKYGARSFVPLEKVKTPYGTFFVCDQCTRIHLMGYLEEKGEE